MDSNSVSFENLEMPLENPFAKTVQTAREAFDSGITLSLEFRRNQLRGLWKLYEENYDGILQALYKDLRKSPYEAEIADFVAVKTDIAIFLKHLKKYSSNEKLPLHLITPFNKGYVRKEPFGVVLIFGTWNFPFQSSLQPLAGAIAAGNCAILKVSEIAAASAKLIADLLPLYLDQKCYHVVQMELAAAKLLLKNKFDYIFFTGSTSAGRSIMQAASLTLTPVTLELGGQNPCYIHPSADYITATKRILWGKFINSGQICIGPGYVLCSEEGKDVFVQVAKDYVKKGYGSDLQKSPDFVRIINKHHFNRLKNLLESTKGTIAMGGQLDEDDLWIEPTIVVNVNPESDALMQEEIFGPILPIITVSSSDEALRIIRSKSKPLSLYIFSEDKNSTEKLMDSTQSGSVCINHVIFQANTPGLPFGGVGDSGMGSFHGKASFDTFSHKRGVLKFSTNRITELLFGLIYPPFTNFTRQYYLSMASIWESVFIPLGGKFTHFVAILTGVIITLLYQSVFPAKL